MFYTIAELLYKSIQSLQHQSCPTNTNDLIKSVEDAFYAQPVEKVNFLNSNESYGKCDAG